MGFAVPDIVFLKKIDGFLRGVNTATENERMAFGHRVAEDPDLSNKVGGKLLLLLDRLDDMQKPEMLGKVFAAYLKGETSYEDFTRAAAGIDRALMQDLLRISTIESGNIDDHWGAELASAGLALAVTLPMFNGAHTFYRLNDAGRLISKVCFDSPPG